jgi:photosystem II stability/assembly factor-like uncharacterized protein
MNKILIFLFLFISTIYLKAQWVQANGPNYGGSVNCLTISGTNIFEGTATGGVLLSTDNGKSWKKVNNGLTNTNVLSLCVSLTEAGGTNIFAGTTDGGIFLSTNNGTNWTQSNSGLSNYDVRAIIVSPNRTGGNNLFAGTLGGGIFLSTNNGTNWIETDTGLTSKYILSLAIKDSNLFAGTNANGVFRSTNNGTSWTAVNQGLARYNFIFSLVSSDSNLFAGTLSGVYLSTNNGTSWQAVNAGLTNSLVYSLAVSHTSSGGTNIFAGTESDIINQSIGVVFLSTNNGTSWTEVDSGIANIGIHAIAVSPKGTESSGTNLFVGNYCGGVFLSTNNGINWISANTEDLTDSYVLSLASSPVGNGSTNLFAGTNKGGVFLSTNNGITWKVVNSGLKNTTVGALAIGQNGLGKTSIFAGTGRLSVSFQSTKYMGIYLSTNNGTGWTSQFNSSIPILSFAVSQDQNSGFNIFAGLGFYTGGILHSKDNGLNWEWADTILESSVQALAINPVDKGSEGTNIFAGCLDGLTFFSTDNGENWIWNDSLYYHNITSLAIIQNNDGPEGVNGINLFAGTDRGVFLSTDNGTNWTSVDSGLAYNLDQFGFPCHGIQALAVHGSNIFAGMDSGGVYLSTNYGTSWTSVNTGLTNKNIITLATDGMNLYAGTYYGGVFMRPLSEMITISDVKNKQNNLPISFSLQQNYPNPFNPTTVIEYQLPKSSFVSLKVYDILGREVKTLVNGYKTLGKYSVSFDASNFASGVYFYRLKSDVYSSIKKMILMK